MSDTPLSSAVTAFVAHKRALGRVYRTEDATLRLLVAFAADRGLDRLDQLTPDQLEAFVASRPRSRPRSFNQLVGITGCFFDWAVTQELLAVSPLRVTRRRETSQRLPFLFDTTDARSLTPQLRSPTMLGQSTAARPTGRSSRSVTGSASAPAKHAGCSYATSTPNVGCWW